MHWIAFTLWLLYGYVIWRRRARTVQWIKSVKPSIRLPLSIGLLLLCAALLVVGLLSVQAGGGLSQYWGWPVILLIGGVFVHGQVLAVMLVLSIMISDDTSDRAESSKIEEEVE